MEEAITAHRDAAAIFRETGDRHGEAWPGNLGAVLRSGAVEEAITADQDAAAIFRETGDRHGEGGALTNLVSRWEGNDSTRRSRPTEMPPRSTGRPATGTARPWRWTISACPGGGGPGWRGVTALKDAAAIFRDTATGNGEDGR